jgi:molecular chaperone DnaJ
MAKNYYDTLGVTKNASKDEIKKAFHKLAHKYHPDKKDGDEAKFKEINEAYQVLSDDAKRQQYDNFGSAGGGFSGQGGTGGFDFSGFSSDDLGGIQFDFGDIFSNIFNGGRGGASTRAKRGRDISVDIEIPFAEAIFGTERQMLINKVSQCEECKGSGAKPGTAMKKCATCAGKGKIQETRQSFLGIINTMQECPTCHGRGEVPEKACGVCNGAGVLKKAEEINVVIPPGIESGEMIRLSGRGEAVTAGVAGDLYVRVHVEKHPVFKRDGANLTMDLPVKLSDALLGGEYAVPTLEGETKVTIPAGVSYGEVLRVRGQGVGPRGGRRGDLLVKVLIKNPTKLSKKAKGLIDELRQEGL